MHVKHDAVGAQPVVYLQTPNWIWSYVVLSILLKHSIQLATSDADVTTTLDRSSELTQFVAELWILQLTVESYVLHYFLL